MLTIKEFIEKEKKELKEYFTKNNASLDIFQVGNNQASNSYIKGKLKDAEELNVKATLYKLEEEATIKELEETVYKSNGVGKIIQLPLPNFNQKDVEYMLNSNDDVDGFIKDSPCTPCTPLGIIKYLEANNYNFKSKTALVIGRSDIVGKPMAKLLLERDCTVIQAHSKTTNLQELVEISDLIIVATGKINTLTKNMKFKKDCYVIDVGINRDEEGKLIGDCERELPVAFQSPVPGGVGLLTRLAIFYNLKTLLEINREWYRIEGSSELTTENNATSFTSSSYNLDESYIRDINKAWLYDGGYNQYKK